jgi:hypothetical protein
MMTTRAPFFFLTLFGISSGAAAQEAAPCNPPCVAGQMCTANGQCVAVTMVQPPPPAPPPAPPPPPPPPPEEREKAGVHTHDGFYFRFGLGGGYFAGSVDTTPKATVTGGHLAVDLAFGGTPVPGLVIGGGIYGSAGGASWESGGTSQKIDSSVVSTIGPFIDWYPDPKDGWHITGMVGLSRFQFTQNNVVDVTSAFGGAVMIGGGYEFWIGKEWSLGILGRLQYAQAQMSELIFNGVTLAGSSVKVSAIVPALLVGITFH